LSNYQPNDTSAFGQVADIYNKMLFSVTAVSRLSKLLEVVHLHAMFPSEVFTADSAVETVAVVAWRGVIVAH